MISLYNISKIHKVAHEEYSAIKNITLSIQKGDFVSLTGASGSGKSTLLDILSMVDRPTFGKFVFDNADVSLMDDDDLTKLRNSKIGIVYQSSNLIQEFNILQNMQIPLLYKGIQAAERKQIVLEMLSEFGIIDKQNVLPADLTRGEQQTVAIARALLNKPGVLILDEPTGNLDSVTSEEIIHILQRLNNQGGLTIILATHDIDIARHAKRVIAIKDGLILKDVTLTNPIIASDVLNKMRQ